MIKERYCSFGLSKLLKENGFDEKTLAYYDDNILCDGFWFEWNRSPLGHVSAPTHQMAMDWLRKKHSILISIIPQEVAVGVYALCYGIYSITEKSYHPIHNGQPANFINDYKDVVEAALKYCLTELMKGGEK